MRFAYQGFLYQTKKTASRNQPIIKDTTSPPWSLQRRFLEKAIV